MELRILDIVLFGTYFIALYLSIFWLIVFLSHKPAPKPKKLTRFPMFSALVPAYNEERSIVSTLNSLVNLDYPKEKKEIIVINDGSSDRTKVIVERYIKEHPDDNITLLNQKNQGKGTAMNKGLSIAKGEFFACLDADSFIKSDGLQVILPYFLRDNNVAAVCPLMKVKKPENVLQKIQWYEYIVNMFYKHLNAKLDSMHVTPGPFSVYRTKVIKELGYFDQKTITEDLEIAMRLQKHNYRIVQTFDTKVETIAPDTLKGIFNQRMRWYRGSVDNTIRYKKMMFNKNYGDFGILRVPTIILSGMIAIVLLFAITNELIKLSINWIEYLVAIKFKIIPVMTYWITHMDMQFNILKLPFSKMFVATTLISLTVFVLIYSYKLIGEKITNHGKTFASLVTYLFLYSILLTVVWTYIGLQVVTGQKTKWHHASDT